MPPPKDSEKTETNDSPAILGQSGQGPSFEEAFNRLGETVQALESGSLTLKEATDIYEEGMRLVQLCNQLLSPAELRVTQLKNAYSTYVAQQTLEEEE